MTTPAPREGEEEEEEEEEPARRKRRRPTRGRAPWEACASDPREATVSARALAKARGTVEDFVLSVFPLLGLEVRDALAFADVLYFVEASLYEADEANEAGILGGGGGGGGGGALAALERFLRGRGLWTWALEAEIRAGEEYWALERDLVEAWRKEKDDDDDVEGHLLARAKRALVLKSFDYRCLCLVTLRLVGRTTEEEEEEEEEEEVPLLRFLFASFTLVELEDDLKDYHNDVVSDAFNVYRAFVRRHGAAAPRAVRRFARARDGLYRRARDAARLTADELSAHRARNEHQQGAGPAMAPTNGAWAVPRPSLPHGDRALRLVATVTGTIPPLFITAADPTANGGADDGGAVDDDDDDDWAAQVLWYPSLDPRHGS